MAMRNKLWGASVELETSRHIEIIAVMAPSKVAAALKVAAYLKECFSKKEASALLDTWVAEATVSKSGIVHYTESRVFDE